MASSSTTPKFEVFISHAGEDKATMAIPLRSMLQEKGTTAFVDEEDMPPGADAKQEMISAMETASVGVIILSPEFIAKEWPMKELLCFLKRREDALSHESSYPVVIPLFYRLSISELYDEPRLDRKGADGKHLFHASRFFDRMKRGDPEADIQTIKNALGKLHGIMGVRNDVDATNGSEHLMSVRRGILLQRTCDAIVQALGKQQNKTTTAYTLFSDSARGVMDLVVSSSKALITLGEGALLRVQEALVARAIADCSECLRLLGNKIWYFCGSTTLPAFVLKMALINQPDAARRKIVDMLLSLALFECPDVTKTSPHVILEFRASNMWDVTTMMDVSFVNALIFKHHFPTVDSSSAIGRTMEAFASDINSGLTISSSDMLLVLQAMRQRWFADQGVAIVLHREQGLGWYRVLFDDADCLEKSSGAPESSGASGLFRLEYICSLQIPEGGTNSLPVMKDIMILNFLHAAVIPPEARTLRERRWYWKFFNVEKTHLETSLTNESNMYEGPQAILDAINVDGEAYTELLEIACIYNLRADYHARCQSYVDTLVEIVDEHQLVISNAGGNRHMSSRQGREISFELLAREFGRSAVKDCKEGKFAASSNDLYEYGRFCAQGEVEESWYDLLVPTVANEMNVNFAQAALTGSGSYTKFVAKNMSVRLKDSIVLCDPASDSIAVAFDGVSELSSSLKVPISELMETSASERLRAAFFICRGAVRTRRNTSTRMLDVMRSRHTGLERIGRISAQDVTEDLDEGELRNRGVIVECMESLAKQGGYTGNGETSLFAALCSNRECEKTFLVTGMWPSLFGTFSILRYGSLYIVQLDNSSKVAIVASRQAGTYRAQGICQVPVATDPNRIPWQFISSNEVVCVQ